jgi:hypothetical protein
MYSIRCLSGWPTCTYIVVFACGDMGFEVESHQGIPRVVGRKSIVLGSW